MQLKTVSVTYGRKINLGDYNSATVDCTLWADLDEGEAPRHLPNHTKGQDDWYQGWWDARQDDGKHPATYSKEQT